MLEIFSGLEITAHDRSKLTHLVNWTMGLDGVKKQDMSAKLTNWLIPLSWYKFQFISMISLQTYDSVANVPESWVWLRADFQSGSRVLKKVFWTFSYLYLWHTMWFHAKKLLKTLKFWKSLNSLFKSGSRHQKSQKKKPKKWITQSQFTQFFLICMVYFWCHLVNPHVQTVQNMYGKGG